MRHGYRVTRYLEANAKLCMETSRNARLLPVFLRIIMMVPATITRLAG
jgi:hypothetical protein